MQESLGRKLRLMRAERGLSLREVARRAGMVKETISDIERGHTHPYDTTLAKLARVYNVRLEELLFEYSPEELARMPRDEFEEIRREANDGLLDRPALDKALSRARDLVEDEYKQLQAPGTPTEVIDEARELVREVKKRWTVVRFDGAEETLALDEKRDPSVPRRPDTRTLPLDEAFAEIRGARSYANHD